MRGSAEMKPRLASLTNREADMPELLERFARVVLDRIRDDRAGDESSASRRFSEENFHVDPLVVLLSKFRSRRYQERARRSQRLPNLFDVLTFLERYNRCGRGVKSYAVLCALVYLDRMRAIDVELTTSNWRPLLFVALISAHKMYEDFYMTSRPYARVLPYTPLKNVAELERVFLQCLDYRMNVTPQEYARYHYALYSLPPLPPPPISFPVPAIAQRQRELAQRELKLARLKADDWRRARRRAKKGLRALRCVGAPRSPAVNALMTFMSAFFVDHPAKWGQYIR